MKNILKIIIIVLVILILKEVILVLYLNKKNIDEVSSYYSNNTSFNYKSNMILVIPKISVKNVVKKADRNFSNLNKSLVYYNNDNYNNKIIIFGHSGVGYGTFFNRLDELKVKDYAYIYKDKLKIMYKVLDKYLVNKTDISVLNSNEKRVLYLITCDKKDKNKRLILKFCVKKAKTLKK